MPWELVLQHWRKTFHTRRINIEKEKENTLLDVFTKWPILKHPNGHSLIIEDFKDMSLSVETLTSDTREAFFQRVISCVKPASKDDQLHVLMKILQAANINDGKCFLYTVFYVKRYVQRYSVTKAWNF